MKSIEIDEKTENLLKSKGLKCVCQLCDCGSHHPHVGCRLRYPNVAYSVKQDDSQKMQSDYQFRFGGYENVRPRKAIIPPLKPKDPNPPPMDFRTENKVAYKLFDQIGKVKSCKLKEEIHFMSGEFGGRSLYEDSFVGYDLKPMSITRPRTVIKSENACFVGETEYRKGFPFKNKIPQEAYHEKPARTYTLLYPDQVQIPKHSLKNLIHNGEKGEKAQLVNTKGSSIHFGSADYAAMTTTNLEQFKKYDVMKPTKSMKPIQTVGPRKRFTAVTQNKSTYSYDENEAAKARAVACKEHPSTIKLSMDIPTDFSTVASMSYNAWKPELFKRTKRVENLANPKSRYTPPKNKFEAISQCHTDFVDFGVDPRPTLVQQPQFRKSSAKLTTKSSYMSQYPAHGVLERQLYGDQHADNLHLPPKSERLESITVMLNDYKARAVEKQKSYKPRQKTHTNEAKFSEETEYTQKYKPTEVQPCTFLKVMAEATMRSNEQEVK